MSFSVAFFLIYSFSFCSGQSGGDLRLWQNGQTSPTFTYGRLQIFINNKWSEVCDVGFSKAEADVACHQLQYRESVGVGSGGNHDEVDTSNLANIGLSDIYCPTNDYLHLLRCSYQVGQHSCTGKKYTMLECVTNRIWDPPYLGQIRIVGSNYSSLGSAQIYCGESGWGNICSSYPFGQNEANTVCRQLGYTDAKDYNHIYNFVKNFSLPLLLNGVDCPDDKQECLGACSVCYQPLNTYCSYYDHLIIECEFDAFHYAFGSNVSTCEYLEGGFIQERPRIGEVRVTPPGSSGVAQVYHDISGNRTWNQICSTGSSTDDSLVATTFCTQLGYTNGTYTTVSPSSSDLLSISCDRKHPHLLWCLVSMTGSCTSVISVSCSVDTDTYYTGQVRLVGGDYPSEGRVEIYVYDAWSTIYTSTYTYNYQDNADSVCRQLGYTGADYYAVGVYPGTGDIRVTSPYCYSKEQCFSHCLYSYDFVGSNSYYGHSNDLSVNCTFNTSLVNMISYGTRSACTIDLPSFSGNSVNVAAAVTIPIVMVILMCILVILLVSVMVSMVKKSNRRARLRATAGGVGYTPQGNTITQQQQGAEGGVYMIPASQIPPQGMLIMPQGAAAGHQPGQTDEDKVPPPYSEEVLPNAAN